LLKTYFTVTKLSVNINKIATIRNARGGTMPNVVNAAIAIQQFGADGITIHPRPDQRHITIKDVYDLRPVVTTEFNIEGYPSKEFIKMMLDIKPEQVTLVPDPPDVLTSNAGWDTIKNFDFLKDIVAELKSNNMRVSLFMDTNHQLIEHAFQTGADRIELYTEAYAANYSINPEEAIKPYLEAALFAQQFGLGLNAGHDLSLENLKYFARIIPDLLEVSIGHALVSDALYYGFEKTIQLYKDQLN
jgi:pyridoxine 5-phosphate synthase